MWVFFLNERHLGWAGASGAMGGNELLWDRAILDELITIRVKLFNIGLTGVPTLIRIKIRRGRGQNKVAV